MQNERKAIILNKNRILLAKAEGIRTRKKNIAAVTKHVQYNKSQFKHFFKKEYNTKKKNIILEAN